MTASGEQADPGRSALEDDTNVHRTQSPALMDLRMACLTDGLTELRTVVDVLASGTLAATPAASSSRARPSSPPSAAAMTRRAR